MVGLRLDHLPQRLLGLGRERIRVDAAEHAHEPLAHHRIVVVTQRLDEQRHKRGEQRAAPSPQPRTVQRGPAAAAALAVTADAHRRPAQAVLPHIPREELDLEGHAHQLVRVQQRRAEQPLRPLVRAKHRRVEQAEGPHRGGGSLPLPDHRRNTLVATRLGCATTRRPTTAIRRLATTRCPSRRAARPPGCAVKPIEEQLEDLAVGRRARQDGESRLGHRLTRSNSRSRRRLARGCAAGAFAPTATASPAAVGARVVVAGPPGWAEQPDEGLDVRREHCLVLRRQSRYHARHAARPRRHRPTTVAATSDEGAGERVDGLSDHLLTMLQRQPPQQPQPRDRRDVVAVAHHREPPQSRRHRLQVLGARAVQQRQLGAKLLVRKLLRLRHRRARRRRVALQRFWRRGLCLVRCARVVVGAKLIEGRIEHRGQHVLQILALESTEEADHVEAIRRRVFVVQRRRERRKVVEHAVRVVGQRLHRRLAHLRLLLGRE